MSAPRIKFRKGGSVVVKSNGRVVFRADTPDAAERCRNFIAGWQDAKAPAPVAPVAPAPAHMAIDAFLSHMAETMGALWSRWQDESEYEDIAAYGAVVAARLPPMFVIGKMSKRPFGFAFTIDHPGRVGQKFRMSVNGSGLQVVRL